MFHSWRKQFLGVFQTEANNEYSDGLMDAELQHGCMQVILCVWRTLGWVQPNVRWRYSITVQSLLSPLSSLPIFFFWGGGGCVLDRIVCCTWGMFLSIAQPLRCLVTVWAVVGSSTHYILVLSGICNLAMDDCKKLLMVFVLMQGWFLIVWNGREVVCIDDLGNTAPSQTCSNFATFSNQRACNMQACSGYYWDVPSWNFCNAPCSGGKRFRDTICKQNGSVVDETFCSSSLAPVSESLCNTQVLLIVCFHLLSLY